MPQTRGRGLVVVAAVAACGLLGWAASDETRLTIADDQARLVLQTGGVLTVRYTHSVARTPVEEDFVAVAGGVRVAATRFSSFGAGLPSQPEWSGSFKADAGQAFRVEGMNVTLPAVTFRIGFGSDQTVVEGGRAIRLDALAPPGSAVTLQSVSKPRWHWWLAERAP